MSVNGWMWQCKWLWVVGITTESTLKSVDLFFNIVPRSTMPSIFGMFPYLSTPDFNWLLINRLLQNHNHLSVVCFKAVKQIKHARQCSIRIMVGKYRSKLPCYQKLFVMHITRRPLELFFQKEKTFPTNPTLVAAPLSATWKSPRRKNEWMHPFCNTF